MLFSQPLLIRYAIFFIITQLKKSLFCTFFRKPLLVIFLSSVLILYIFMTFFKKIFFGFFGGLGFTH
jgi:hypothetical protein